MVEYMIKRILVMLPTLFLVLVTSFFLIRLIPGDPAAVMLGSNATPEQVEQLRHWLGLDQPLGVQFAKYIIRVFRGDFGYSILYHLPITQLLCSRLEVTVLLSVCTMLVVLCLGIPAGILASVRPNTLFDQLLLVVVLIGASFPTFWLGLLLMICFSLKLGWFPVSGFRSIFETGNLANLRYLVLPAITLGFVNATLLARMTRASMLEVLGENYVNTARSKGVHETRVVLKHALRNAAIPIITVGSLTLAGLLGGAVITENVFALPGIGSLLIQAVLQRDYPTIQAIMVYVAFLYLFINLVTDILYAFLDPRIRYGGER